MRKIVESAAQFLNCTLPYAYSPRAATHSCAGTSKNFIKFI